MYLTLPYISITFPDMVYSHCGDLEVSSEWGVMGPYYTSLPQAPWQIQTNS